MAKGQYWCKVELSNFPSADFDQVGERRLHARNLPTPQAVPHFADGYEKEIPPWRAPIRAPEAGKRE